MTSSKQNKNSGPSDGQILRRSFLAGALTFPVTIAAIVGAIKAGEFIEDGFYKVVPLEPPRQLSWREAAGAGYFFAAPMAMATTIIALCESPIGNEGSEISSPENPAL